MDDLSGWLKKIEEMGQVKMVEGADSNMEGIAIKLTIPPAPTDSLQIAASLNVI